MTVQEQRDERSDAKRDGTPIGPPVDYEQPIHVNPPAPEVVAEFECLTCQEFSDGMVHGPIPADPTCRAAGHDVREVRR